MRAALRKIRPSRNDLFGIVFLLFVITAFVLLVLIALTAPLVILSIVAAAFIVWAGHVFGDEIAAWIEGREDEAPPVLHALTCDCPRCLDAYGRVDGSGDDT